MIIGERKQKSHIRLCKTPQIREEVGLRLDCCVSDRIELNKRMMNEYMSYDTERMSVIR